MPERGCEMTMRVAVLQGGWQRLFLVALTAALGFGQQVNLEGTEPLTWQGPLDERMLDGLHAFIDRKLQRSVDSRARLWSRDFSSVAAYESSIEPNRNRFRTIIGVVDDRVAPSMERYGHDDRPALVAETSAFQAYQVRWPVLDGVTGEGLLLEPVGDPVGYVVAIPDADQTPEMITGLAPGADPKAQFARRLAESGFEVVVPMLINRAAEVSGHPDVSWTNLPHREWIYRQAFVMGRHVIGYDVQKVLSAVDWFRKHRGSSAKVGVAGYGEGGLVALYAAASDTGIEAALVSGYFSSRQAVWEEPLDRTVWGLLREFGDAEIATLIAPRGLVVEHSPVPIFNGPSDPPEGWRRAAAPGKTTTPPLQVVRAEVERAKAILPDGFQSLELVTGSGGTIAQAGSDEALNQFFRMLDAPSRVRPLGEAPKDRRRGFDPRKRQHRQVKELERRVQEMVAGSGYVRDRFYMYAAMPELKAKPPPRILKAETYSAEQFAEASTRFREYFHEEVIGRLDDQLLEPNPRSRQIIDNENWVAHEVVLDVFPDVFAWGILLLPKDLKPGERRPVVVTQHGYNGLPRHTVDADDPYYRNYAARLAERGFVVFAPHNFYRDNGPISVARQESQGVEADDVFVHHGPASADSQLAVVAPLRRWRPDRLLRP